jgi:hypothetical protein
MVLITYHYKSKRSYSPDGSFHYDIAQSATDWIEKMEDVTFSDGTYVLINVLEITDEQAARYDGNLQSM